MLGLEELAHHLLVGGRLLLDRAVVAVVEAGLEAVAPEAERAPEPLGGLRADGAVLDELLEPGERRLGGLDPHLRVLALGAAVVADSEHADQRRQRQPLQDERRDDHANVRKTISPRSGKSVGSASAATRETAPRIPAHESSAGHCQGGYGSRSRIDGTAQRGR